ncbi:MAG TPA: ATP-binding protein [Terriglobales bacterium]|nr:ATP-binding protein [Terriglobales bacterium]
MLLAVLPTLGLVLYSGVEQRRRAEERSREQARHLTELACVNIDDALHDAQVMLETLTQTPELREGDAAVCERLFEQVLNREATHVPRSLHPARIASRPLGGAREPGRRMPYDAITLADLEGHVVAASPRTPGRTNVADQPWFKLAIATHTFSFSADPLTRGTQRPALDVGYRALGADGRVRGVLAVSVEMDWLGAAIATDQLPAGGELVVLDSRGTVLAHFPESARFVGQPYTDAPVVHEVLSRKQGEAEAASLDGAVRLWSFRPVTVAPGSDLFVALGFTPRVIYAEADRGTMYLTLVLALIVLTTSLALWLWAQRFILRPVDRLTRATSRLREGDLSARAQLEEVGELGDLGRSFDAMADELQSREQELRASKQTTEAVLASSPVAIVTLSRSGRITLWTPAAERLLGWTADEVLGREIPFAASDEAPASGGLSDLLARGAPFIDLECAGVHRDGRPLELSVSSLPLTKPDGTVTGRVLAIADLTARRQLEGQLRHSQQMEALGRLAGGVAHDFNNLLTVIQGHSESLLESPGLDEAARQQLEGVRRSAQRGSELTRQLFAFGGQQTSEPQIVDLNELVRGMTSMLRRLIGEDIQLEVSLRAARARLEADPGKIEQVVTYLIVHSRDVMPRGGRLVIETGNRSCTPDEMRRCRGGCRGTCVTLSVSDTGPAMDPETLEHVFEPFYTAGGSRHGGGLALAAVNGIVEQCGGEIRVVSEPGRGTTFQIYWPLVEEPEGAAAPGGAVPESGSILLVEDEPEVRAVARVALEKAGYHVLEARHGEEALAVAARGDHAIRLLLTDIVMPEMGGPELARQLRQMIPGMRVLYFSGYAPGTSGRPAIALDAPFLAKPFRPRTLIEKVRDVLAG